MTSRNLIITEIVSGKRGDVNYCKNAIKTLRESTGDQKSEIIVITILTDRTLRSDLKRKELEDELTKLATDKVSIAYYAVNDWGMLSTVLNQLRPMPRRPKLAMDQLVMIPSAHRLLSTVSPNGQMQSVGAILFKNIEQHIDTEETRITLYTELNRFSAAEDFLMRMKNKGLHIKKVGTLGNYSTVYEYRYRKREKVYTFRFELSVLHFLVAYQDQQLQVSVNMGMMSNQMRANFYKLRYRFQSAPPNLDMKRLVISTYIPNNSFNNPNNFDQQDILKVIQEPGLQKMLYEYGITSLEVHFYGKEENKQILSTKENKQDNLAVVTAEEHVLMNQKPFVTKILATDLYINSGDSSFMEYLYLDGPAPWLYCSKSHKTELEPYANYLIRDNKLIPNAQVLSSYEDRDMPSVYKMLTETILFSLYYKIFRANQNDNKLDERCKEACRQYQVDSEQIKNKVCHQFYAPIQISISGLETQVDSEIEKENRKRILKDRTNTIIDGVSFAERVKKF